MNKASLKKLEDELGDAVYVLAPRFWFWVVRCAQSGLKDGSTRLDALRNNIANVNRSGTVVRELVATK